MPQGEAAEALQHVTTQVADPEEIITGKIRCDGRGDFEGNLLSLVKSKSKLTDHTPLKEIYSQSEVPVRQLVVLPAYCWEIPTFPTNYGLKQSRPGCTLKKALQRMFWVGSPPSRYGKIKL